MTHRCLTHFAALCAGTLLLAGCGGAPDESQVRTAIAAQLEAFAGKAGAASFKDTLQELKLIGCKSSERGGYFCDWTSSMGAGSGRFVKTDGGWTMVAP
ncbi:hypothetical protein [Acidovorax sp. FG27]|uniref:hypothetical protein n=1 Tax=Acidovorax sp. FG27 TaxID=3133652 RepID=UPI0030E8298D